MYENLGWCTRLDFAASKLKGNVKSATVNTCITGHVKADLCVQLGGGSGGLHGANRCCPSSHKLPDRLLPAYPETPHCGEKVSTAASAIC